MVEISGFEPPPPLVLKSKQSVGFQVACSYSATSKAANTDTVATAYGGFKVMGSDFQPSLPSIIF